MTAGPLFPGSRGAAKVAVLLWWLLAAPAGAADAPVIDIPVHRHVLDNGLTVLMVERHQAPVISAVISVGVGSTSERPGQTGLAHLLEHMAFKGTRRLGVTDYKTERGLLAEIDRQVIRRQQLEQEGEKDGDTLAALDASILKLREQAKTHVVPNAFAALYHRHGGVGLNASTSPDMTRYVVSFPANRLPLWAAVESERLTWPVLREFYAEREVVQEERRSRVDTSPGGQLREIFFSTSFTTHPYRNPVIGWDADLKKLTRPQAVAFFEAHYVPANMVISLVGDLDPEQTLAAIRKTFGKMPARAYTRPALPSEPPQTQPRRVTVSFAAEPQLMMGFPSPPLGHDDVVAMSILDEVLTGGRVSRLYQALVRDKQIATSVRSGWGSPGSRHPNRLIISASPRHPHTVAEVEAAILEEIARLRDEPITGQELERALTQWEAGLIRGLGSNSGLASQLGYYEMQTGDWAYLNKTYTQATHITPQEIQAVARRYLTPEQLTVAQLLPLAEDGESTP